MNIHHSSVWFALSLMYLLTVVVFGGREGVITGLMWYPLFLLVVVLLNRGAFKTKRKAPLPPDIEGR